MNIKPLDDRVLIEPISKEEQTKSGIILPDTAEEKPEQGKVVAVGPGKFDESGKRIPLTVKVGDTILFAKYSPHEVKFDKKEYLIVKEEDILAIID